MKKNKYIARVALMDIKKIIPVAALVGFFTQAVVCAQQPQNFGNFIDWASLETVGVAVDPNGLDAGLLTSATGQTLKLDNLGSYYEGNTVTVRVIGGALTVTNNPALNGYQAMHLQVDDGEAARIEYTFDQALQARLFGGGSVAVSERSTFSSNGSATAGGLLNQDGLLAAQLTVSNNAVYNARDFAIQAPGGLRWQSDAAYVNHVAAITNVVVGDPDPAGPPLATVFTLSVGQVPEPSTVLLLGVGFASLLVRRKR